MVKIRLRRRGRKQAPLYDIVAMDSRKTRDGAYLEYLGQYNPVGFPSKVVLKDDRALAWLKMGAQPTDMARAILSHEGVLLQMYLERKGTSAEEIASELTKHKETVAKRLERLGKKRATRLSKKKKSAIEAAKAAEAAAKAAEAAAKEAAKAADAAAKEAEAAAKAAAPVEAPAAE
ncbi:MAG: 30S ribosomal protein S16 [Candidatus Kapaibacterium sp.]|nr:MAG: 30S ribosomal protein S16 [Candidatus Kapabacteria bacterium]